jgi:hypothetical protein
MKNNQQGQSTIEFIFSFIFAVSFILMVFNTALNYVTGYVVHYATFMASRAMVTQSSSQANWGPGDTFNLAETAAKETFAKYSLNVFNIDANAFQVSDAARRDEVSAGEFLMIGAYTKFQRRIDIVGQITGQSKLDLISESFLGREPSRGVCASRVCYAITGKDACGIDMDVTLFDDGC